MALKLPPQNIESEKAVIGSILIDNDTFNKIGDILKPEFFYDPKHQIIFSNILALYNSSKPIDFLTLSTELKKNKKLKEAGGAEYLNEVLNFVPTSANVIEYANIVKENAIRRLLITYSGKFDELARKEDEPLDNVLNTLEKDVFALSQDSTRTDFAGASELVELQMAKADEYAKNPGALRGLATGLRDLDKHLGGLHKSDLIILAARPSVGKSAFSFDIARHIAINGGKTVAIFSLEMPNVQVIERVMAAQVHMDLWDIRMGNVKDWDKYSKGVGEISNAKLFVDDTAGINIMQLRSKVRRLKLEHDLDFVLIDYLQLMQGSGSKSSADNRAQEVGEISRSLKILARELKIPIMALSQLNRSVETRGGVPQLSDLRESGSIEQDADLVMFLSRDMTATEDMDAAEANPKIDVSVTIAKHRNGPIGSVKVRFVSRQTRFEDWND
jgi:replicative DNA helicase